jgi:hypothetical protein
MSKSDGGSAPKRQDYFDTFDMELSGDVRINGIGEGNEAGKYIFNLVKLLFHTCFRFAN